MAFDRSMRRIDQDGRLHVEISAISKSIVNPYYGREIPNSEELGLEPDRVYMLLRDPGELERAAATFNNIPVLSKHVPVTADKPQKELVVGSTGTDAMFAAPYLMNSLVVWDAVAIAGINSKEQCELSSAYRYRADMTPGTFEGVQYDGVMRDIQGNHVALVEVGRAGPDVYVFDSQPLEQKMKRSRLAIAISAALAAHMVPKLAQDAKLGDLGPVVGKVKKETIEADAARIAAAVVTQSKGKLAQDAALDAEEIKRVVKLALDAAAGDDDDDKTAEDEDDEDDEEKKKAKAAAGASDDDEDDEDKDGKKAQQAMDAAIAKAQSETVARMNAIRQAEKDVAPFIGEVVAQDSADAVYKLALDAAKIDVTGVHPSAYRAMVAMLPKPGAIKDVTPRIAADAATANDFSKRFPTAKVPARG